MLTLIKKITKNLWSQKSLPTEPTEIPRNLLLDKCLSDLVKSLANDSYSDLDEVERSKKVASDIALDVKNKGYLLIPSVLPMELIKNLRLEFDHIISNANQLPYKVDSHNGSICVRVRPRWSLLSQGYPITSAIFDCELFRQISEAFYCVGEEQLTFNSEIFVHETPVTTQPLSKSLHWDRSQTLKFWIYVDDVPLEAGPMRVVPGSAKSNRARKSTLSKKNTGLKGGVDNLADESGADTEHLTGASGTILIHDTDCSHGATNVSSGYVRRIMRGHTRLA